MVERINQGTKYKDWYDKDNNIILFSQNESLTADDIREVTPRIEHVVKETGLECILTICHEAPRQTWIKKRGEP